VIASGMEDVMSFNPFKVVENAVGSGVHALGNAAKDAGKEFEGALKDAAQAAKHISPSELGHTALDIASFVPGLGIATGLINAGWYAAEGDWGNAALSAATAIPVAGDFVDAAKVGKDVVTIGKDVETAVKLSEDAATAAKVAKDGEDVAQAGADVEKAGAAPTQPATSPGITPEELSGKTRTEIRDMANNKGLVPKGDTAHPDYPRKWSDPVTGEPRLRLDRGHTDPTTGQPYNNPNAAIDHVHGYEPGGNPIKVNGDKHVPTTGE
jgi:hypothetical protein